MQKLTSKLYLLLFLLSGSLFGNGSNEASTGSCTTQGAGCSCSIGTVTSCTQCSRTGSDYSYTETLSSSTIIESTTRTIVISGCPNHPFTDYTPNTACKGSLTMTVPALPKYISSTSSSDYTSLKNAGGATGILFDGATVYSAFGGQGFGTVTSYTNSAPYAEGYSFDQCGQHSSGSSPGAYHSHVPPSCLLNQLGASTTAPSPLLGYMVDGFPIYGPRGPNGIYMKNCGQTGADSTYCTDSCGGYFDDSQSVWADGYVYRYFVMGPYNGISDICANDLWRDGIYSGNGQTITNTPYASCNYAFAQTFYPFTPLCLRGCVPSSMTATLGFSTSGLQTSPTCPSDPSKYIAGYTDTSKIKTTNALPVTPYLTALTSCMNNDCSNGYPNPNTCVHDLNTGAYIDPTLSPTLTPSSATRLPTSPSSSPSVAPTMPTLTPTFRPSSPSVAPISAPTPVPVTNPSPSSSSSSSSSCFASNELVELSSGVMRAISALSVGDEVVVMDKMGSLRTSPVVAVPHGPNKVLSVFRQIRAVSGGSIVLTPNHLIMAHKRISSNGLLYDCEHMNVTAFQLFAAVDVAVGDCILSKSGIGEEVATTLELWDRGIYTIVTKEDYLVVAGYVASPFSTNHRIPDAFYQSHRYVYSLAPQYFTAWSTWSQFVSQIVGDLINLQFTIFRMDQMSTARLGAYSLA